MKFLLAALLSCTLSTSVLAQESEEDNGPLGNLSQDAQDAIKKLLEALRPGFDELLNELLNRIDDLSLYEAPEILPNGDIIIRRKKDAPPLPDGQIDL